MQLRPKFKVHKNVSFSFYVTSLYEETRQRVINIMSVIKQSLCTFPGVINFPKQVAWRNKYYVSSIGRIGSCIQMKIVTFFF